MLIKKDLEPFKGSYPAIWSIKANKMKNQGPADACIKKCPGTMAIFHNLRPPNHGICACGNVRLVGAHPCWWDTWWDSHLVRWVDSWWDGRTLGEMAGLLVIFLDSWWDLWTLGEMLEMLVKLIITKIITFNTDSSYDTEIKEHNYDLMMVTILDAYKKKVCGDIFLTSQSVVNIIYARNVIIYHW